MRGSKGYISKIKIGEFTSLMTAGQGASVLTEAAGWVFVFEQLFSRLSFLFSYSLSLGNDPI